MKDHVAEIVAAYVRKNAIAIDQLPALIATVAKSLACRSWARAAIFTARAAQTCYCHPPERDARRRHLPTDCGHKAQMLKRHLSNAHKLTVDDYKAKWSLPSRLSHGCSELCAAPIDAREVIRVWDT